MATLVMLGRNSLMVTMGAKPFANAGHCITTTTDDQHAQSLIQKGGVDMLILGMAVEPSARRAMREWLAQSGLTTKLAEPQGPQDLPSLLSQLQLLRSE
jgi:hypothetical protein